MVFFFFTKKHLTTFPSYFINTFQVAVIKFILTFTFPKMKAILELQSEALVAKYDPMHLISKKHRNSN